MRNTKANLKQLLATGSKHNAGARQSLADIRWNSRPAYHLQLCTPAEPLHLSMLSRPTSEVHTLRPSCQLLTLPDCREDCIIATKVTGPSAHMEWIRGGPTSLNAQNIQEALDSSLMRLQTDYIDIFQLHWPDRFPMPMPNSTPNFDDSIASMPCVICPWHLALVACLSVCLSLCGEHFCQSNSCIEKLCFASCKQCLVWASHVKDSGA